MTKPHSIKCLARIIATAALIGVGGHAQAAFIGNLDGVSNSSTFEVSGVTNLPALGWSNVSGTARAWDSMTNGLLIATSDYANYEVEYDTGVAIQSNTQYSLHFDMGYAANLTGGNSGFSFQLGTINGGIFTGLGSPITGTAPYAGNMSIGLAPTSADDDQIFTTGDTVSGDNLAVRWAQTSTLGTPLSDFFGFDNVTLDAVVVGSAIPEPSTFLLLGLGALGLVRHPQRRRRRA